MNKLLVTLSFLISLTCLSSQSWALLNCPSSPPFDNCYGSYVFSSGNKYVGEWQNNKYNGQGIFTWKKTGSEYLGEWKDGKKHGPGTYIFGPNSKTAGDKYIGQYKDKKQHGQGTYIFGPNSKTAREKYIGEYENGKRNGQGILYKWNGDKYDGQFKENKYNGHGTYIFADGEVKEGIFKDGKFMYAKESTPSSNSKIEEYKSFCSEIGFTPGTEKFGECVVEAMKKG